MKKLFKFITGSLLALLIITGLCLITLTTLISPNKLKGPLTQQLSSSMGKEILINGDLKWSFLPWFHLQANDVLVKNPSTFGNTAFAKIEQINISLNLLPLLHQQFEMGKISLKSAHINFIKNKDGQNNWSNNSKAAQATSKAEGKSDKFSLAPLALTITAIDLANAQISYKDLQAGQTYQVTNLNLKSNNIKFNHAFPLSLNGTLNAPKQHLEGKVSLNSDITVNTENNSLEINPASLVLNLKDSASNKTILNSKLNTKLHLVLNSSYKISGRLNTNQVEYNGLKLENVSVPIQITPEAIRLNPITANLYQGSAQAKVIIKTQGNNNQYFIEENINNIQAEQFFKPYLENKKLQVTGTANVAATLNTQGNDSASLTKNLDGNIKFAVSHGALEGIDLMHELQKGVALFKKQPETKENTNLNRTAFDNLTGSIQIRQGVADNKDLSLKSSDLSVEGQGGANLVTQQINYLLKVTLQSTRIDPKILDLQNSLGGSIPVRVSGSFTDHKIYPDTTTIAKGVARNQINKGTEKLKDEINKRIPGLGNQLQQGLNLLLQKS